MNAFGAWASSGAALPKISFDTSTTPGSAAQDGVNRLLYGPITEAGQEQDLALTISYTDPTTGEILEADTIFNSAYSWGSVGATAESWGATTGAAPYDLQNVATHEAGHFFGLGEDYTDTTTAMYYASSPAQITKRDLTPSDISVVSGLYSAPVASPDKAGCQARIAGGHGTDGGALAAFCVSAFVVSRRRRRA